MFDKVPKDSDFYHNLTFHKRAQQPYSLITGGRGVGKTYQVKKEAFACAASGGEFLYIRRTDKEIDGRAFSDWCDDLSQLSGKNITLQLNGHELILKENGETPRRFGWAYALTQSNQARGYNYQKVKFALFDEFLPELTKYRKFYAGEVNDLRSLVSTFFRQRQAKVYMLSNLTSAVNPYYNAFRIINPAWPGITKTNEAILEIIPPLAINDYYAKNVNYVKNTYDEDYRNYLAGKALLENRQKLEKGKIPRNARYMGRIDFLGQSLGFFLDPQGRAIYLGKGDPSDRRVFVLDNSDINANTFLIKRSTDSYLFKLLAEYYKCGKIISKSPERELLFCEIADRLHFY